MGEVQQYWKPPIAFLYVLCFVGTYSDTCCTLVMFSLGTLDVCQCILYYSVPALTTNKTSSTAAQVFKAHLPLFLQGGVAGITQEASTTSLHIKICFGA